MVLLNVCQASTLALMVVYSGDLFPVAFGWFSNKEALGYLIFFLLLLEEFRFRAEEIKQRSLHQP